MLENDLLIRVAKGEKTERPPVWLMRQAGRILPQYRALRAEYESFVHFVKSPEGVSEATVQPVDELGVDAAILFSDILVIPEAMGLGYEMIPGKGPFFPTTITSMAEVAKLDTGIQAAEKLGYVYEGIDATLKRLKNRVPLLGFAGAPWTIFAYMVEGSGSKTFSKAKKMLYQEPDLSHALLDKISETTIAYVKQKIKHGVALIQLFDSWAGLLGPELYQSFGWPYMLKIADAITEVPVTLFSKGSHYLLPQLDASSANVIGLDWTMNPVAARKQVGTGRVLQGNLDPCALYQAPEELAPKVQMMLSSFGPHHIANLGHGVYPDTPLDSVKTFVNTVKAYRY